LTPNVHIVILNWNGYQDTIACVESCLQSVYPAFRILIVDNGSDDNSETVLRQHFPAVEILQTGSNLGFAGGNNVGIRRALACGADYVWLLNNDTIVAPEALTELVKVAASAPRVGMVGSKILFHDEPDKIWFAGAFWTADGANIHHRGFGEKDAGQYDEPCNVDALTGCSLLVKAELIKSIGLMREDYFLYSEDADWCRTAAEHGYELLYVPASKVWHKVSGSVGNSSSLQWYYYTRNSCLFIERHKREKLFAHIVFHQSYQLRKALREKSREAVKGIVAGLKDYFLRRFGMRRK
jgi:GT2 family glycosyltransferase